MIHSDSRFKADMNFLDFACHHLSVTYEQSQAREKRLCQMASEAVDLFMLAWFDLKKLPDFRERMSPQSDQHIALVTLIARQIRFLDAARASALVGSPEPVIVLNRCMFETWLSVLAISFLRTRDWTPERLGTRFLAHNDFILAKMAKKMRKGLLESAARRGIDRRAVLRTLREPKGRERVPAGTFDNANSPWYPFKENGRASLSAMSNALWPTGGKRRFPKQVFPLGRKFWSKQLDLFWSYPSDVVHTTGSIAGRYIRAEAAGMIHDNRSFEAHGLLVAIDFARSSIQAVAIVVGMEREWEMTSHRSFRLYEHIQAQLRPYLAIESATVNS